MLDEQSEEGEHIVLWTETDDGKLGMEIHGGDGRRGVADGGAGRGGSRRRFVCVCVWRAAAATSGRETANALKSMARLY